MRVDVRNRMETARDRETGRFGEQPRGEGPDLELVRELPPHFDDLSLLHQTGADLRFTRYSGQDEPNFDLDTDMDDDWAVELEEAANRVGWVELAKIGTVSATEDFRVGVKHVEEHLDISAERLAQWRASIETQDAIPDMPAVPEFVESPVYPSAKDFPSHAPFGDSLATFGGTETSGGVTRLPGTSWTRYDPHLMTQIPEHLRPTGPDGVFEDHGQYDAYVPYIPDRAGRDAIAGAERRGFLAASMYVPPANLAESAAHRIIAVDAGAYPLHPEFDQIDEKSFFANKIVDAKGYKSHGLLAASTMAGQPTNEYEQGDCYATPRGVSFFRVNPEYAHLVPHSQCLIMSDGSWVTNEIGWTAMDAAIGHDDGSARAAMRLARLRGPQDFAADSEGITPSANFGELPDYPEVGTGSRELESYWDRVDPGWRDKS